MELLGVSLEKSTFTVFFWIKLEWKNNNLVFKFLHEDFRLNNVNVMTNLTIWRPQLKFYHIYDDQMKTLMPMKGLLPTGDRLVRSVSSIQRQQCELKHLETHSG